MKMFIRKMAAAAIGAITIFAGVTAVAQAEELVLDNGGLIESVRQDPMGAVFVGLSAKQTGLGLDSEAWTTRVRFSTGLDTWLVPQAENTYQLPVRSGEVSYLVYDTTTGYELAAGYFDLRFPDSGGANVYDEGFHFVNGREWFTECGPYSQTERCRTDIWATQASLVGGRVVQTTGWTFNNLTYQPSARSLWVNNPLGNTGEWTADDGRHWRTECDTAKTGRNGCRSYTYNLVVRSNGSTGMEWVVNNIVRFS